MSNKFDNLKRWTEANEVDDLTLIRQWERFIWQQVNYWAGRYKLGDDDRRDLFAHVQMDLMELPQESRPFNVVVGNTIKWKVQRWVQYFAGGGQSQWVNNSSPAPTIGFEQLADSVDADGINAEELVTSLDTRDSGRSLEEQVIDKLTLQKCLEALDERERLIITLYYGLSGVPSLGSYDIGTKIGISHQQVTNILNKAHEKMGRTARGLPQARKTGGNWRRWNRSCEDSKAATDLTGQKIGYVTAIARVGSSHNAGVLWQYQCDCGHSGVKLAKELLGSTYCTRSCGMRAKKAADECKNGCGKPGKLYSKYTTGDFCSRECARSFSTKERRAQKFSNK